MDVEDYFIIALVFAIVASLSFLMSNNPFGMMSGVNVDSDIVSNSFYFGYVPPLSSNYRIYMVNSALSLFITLPLVYFSIAFAIGGLLKILVKKLK